MQAHVMRGMNPRKLSTDVRGMAGGGRGERNHAALTEQNRMEEKRSTMGSAPTGVFLHRKKSQSGLYIPLQHTTSPRPKVKTEFDISHQTTMKNNLQKL